jgi:hypothetical protein
MYVWRKDKYNICLKGSVLEINRSLRLIGGMFEEVQNFDVFMIDETVIDFGFIEQFVLDTPDGIEWIRLVNENPM